MIAPVLIACLSLLDVKSARCETACHFHGYDTGTWNERLNRCECVNRFELEEIDDKRILPAKKAKPGYY